MKKLSMFSTALVSACLISTAASAHPCPTETAKAEAPKRYIKAPGRCDQPSEDTYRAIKNGMSIDQAENIMGCRAMEIGQNRGYDNSEIIRYKFNNGRRIHVFLSTRNGRVSQKSR